MAVYEKGPKVLLQGRGIEDFVKFTLEPEIFGEARLGYEEVHSPEMFQPHFGVDESGKGDFFGPLVIAGVFADRQSARQFLDLGVQDSKRIGSDARIYAFAKEIRRIARDATDVVAIGPARYNELYKKFGNLNSLLGWGHARVIENLLARRPDCPRSLSDQFADARVIENALLRHGQKIRIEQRPRAESDIAVAAASILAREAFINWLGAQGEGTWGEARPWGVGRNQDHCGWHCGKARTTDAFPNRQSPFPHGARGRADLFSCAAAEARLDALAVHCQRPEGQDSCSAGLQTAALFVETRVLILNPDPVFEGPVAFDFRL